MEVRVQPYWTVKATMEVCMMLPDVAVMVTFDVPEATESEAVNVSVLAPPVIGFAANVAVTPLGRLVAMKV